MKLAAPVNSNYAATVVTIQNVVQLDNCDNVVAAPLFGYQAIVSKDTVVGTRGLLFPPEVQLSEVYARENNLFRHNELNANPACLEKGYLEDNRRVRAMKFRGHTSNALFMPLESLHFTGIDIDALTDGDSFDKLHGYDICQKYLVKQLGVQREQKNKLKKPSRIEDKFLPQHYDTDNYFRNVDNLNPELNVVITAKLHGTSVRIANTVVNKTYSKWRKLVAKVFGLTLATTEYDYVYGSRRVIKDVNNPDHNHFYDSDIWTLAGEQLKGLLPEGFVIYGELIGWTPSGAAIQSNYTYDVPVGQFRLYVYRVAFINSQGFTFDLAWDQLKEFCKDRGLNAVPELWRGKLKNFAAESWLDDRFNDLGYDTPALGNNKLVDEGVCVRIDSSSAPYILKAKSPAFLMHETKLLDSNTADIETDA